MQTQSIIDILINADRNETSTLVQATRKAITIAQAISITSK